MLTQSVALCESFAGGPLEVVPSRDVWRCGPTSAIADHILRFRSAFEASQHRDDQATRQSDFSPYLFYPNYQSPLSNPKCFNTLESSFTIATSDDSEERRMI